MAFFSKIWKGIKTGVKSIGQKIKKAAVSVGKFMDKIGIVGQIALMFVLPGIGAMLAKGASMMAAAASPILSGVGKVLQTAGKFASTAGNAFKTVTDGVSGFVSKVGGSFINTVSKGLGGSGTLISSAPTTVTEGFKQWMGGMAESAKGITSPFTKAATDAVTTSVAPTAPNPYTEFSNQVNKNIEEGFANTFDSSTYTNFTPDQKDFKFYEVPVEGLGKIADAEITNNGGFFKAAANTIKEMPTTILNKGAGMAADAVVNKGLQAVGLSSEPNYTQNSYTTITPKFDSTPINSVYEQQGVGYGALPDNRIQFLAAQQIPDADYGFGAFNQFRKLGTV